MIAGSQPQLFSSDGEVGETTVSYRLVQLEVYNWGPFRGLHRAEFDPYGTAIIGPTGSGKTTLVDALMTLLVAQPKYNLASTGGHESDCTLFSYVRGVLGGDGSDGREEVARPGKTFTGICATYQAGSETLRLGGLLWVEGVSSAADDLKKRWIFSQASDQSLELWLQQLHGEGVRDLMRAGRETANLQIFDSKTAYLARTRKFFDVGDNAFILLNRAAGLKQLNSIDEIFRDLVLDDRSAFGRALEVAGEFDNLVGIHAELETARKQRDTLLPVARDYEKLLKEREEIDRWETLKRIVRIWFAIKSRQKWYEELESLSAAYKELQGELQLEQERALTCQSQAEALRERYLRLGGNTIAELENTIAAQKKLVAERGKSAIEYRRIIAAFELNDELNQETLHRNQIWLTQKQGELNTARDQQFNVMAAAQSQQQELERTRDDLLLALKKVKERPGSNIPPAFQDFRAEMASELSVPEGSLPFLAELVEVKPEEGAWRGAIERAIGAERLRVLVPEKWIDKALHWINHRHNRLHVRLQEAPLKEQQTSFFEDGYAHKLNFKNHGLQATAKRMLGGRDRHCVSSPEALRRIDHGLTVQGLMSGRQGTFDKQDHRRIEEDWMTGFDNKDQLDALTTQLAVASESLEQQNAKLQVQREVYRRFEPQLMLINTVISLDFSTIDLPSAESELKNSEERLALLLSPCSDASLAKSEFDEAEAKLKAIHERIRQFDRDIAVNDSQSMAARTEIKNAESRVAEGLTEEETIEAEKSFELSPKITARDIADAQRKAENNIDDKLAEHGSRVSQLEKSLVKSMVVAKQADTGALVDVDAEIDDIPHYLDRLRVLTEEALPEKRTRFLEYLNRSSDQGVTQLLAGIAEEVDAIEQRIRELNQTLVKVDFRSGRYLQLQPQRFTHERLRSLETAIRKVRNAALKEDEGESHYKALRELVEILRDAGHNTRHVGSRALLDPRFRLNFFVVEVDRQTGSQSPPRTGSQSGSGGEKELMASHILTASLSYALCPTGASRPLYGTVILDEAFSKSSPSAASRIIDALRIFCLHPIFVTPNKEIGLLKQHTRKVICVQRPGKESSLASITWEKLDELASRP